MTKQFSSRPSLYLDTSVVGGYYDAEFWVDTCTLWRLRGAGYFQFFASVLVEQEIVGAPESVRALMRSTFAPVDILPISAEALQLAAHYLARAVVPIDYTDDARHVAICTVAQLDYLVSWNFKHLANEFREAGFNAVNVLQGYPQVRIVTPTFLIHDREKENF